MNKFLKGTYDLNKEIAGTHETEMSIEDDFRKRAINSIGGSMVFVERNKMVWDGNGNEKIDDDVVTTDLNNLS